MTVHSAMSSEKVGVQSRIREHSPTALYTHCNSHVLNLSISAACKMPSMRNMIDNVIEISLFFGTSPKRRWIERHHSTNFLGLSVQHKNLFWIQVLSKLKLLICLWNGIGRRGSSSRIALCNEVLVFPCSIHNGKECLKNH